MELPQDNEEQKLTKQKVSKVQWLMQLLPKSVRERVRRNSTNSMHDTNTNKKNDLPNPLSAYQLREIPGGNRRISEKALRFFGDEGLFRASAEAVTQQEREQARAHPKVALLLGEPGLISDSLKRRLGEDMSPKQCRAARKAEEEMENARERIRRDSFNQICAMKPTKEQLDLPSGMQVNEKALRILGDEYLNTLSRTALTPEMRQNISPKTLSFFGDNALLSPKQRQLLGSLDFEPRKRSFVSMSAVCVTVQ